MGRFLLALAALVLAATTAPAFAQNSDVKSFTIKRGQKVVVSKAHFYDPGGCRPMPPQLPQVWAQPPVGRVVSEVKDTVLDYGVCKGKVGTLAQLIFEAGSQPGEGSFIIVIPPEYSAQYQPQNITFRFRVQ